MLKWKVTCALICWPTSYWSNFFWQKKHFFLIFSALPTTTESPQKYTDCLFCWSNVFNMCFNLTGASELVFRGGHPFSGSTVCIHVQVFQNGHSLPGCSWWGYYCTLALTKDINPWYESEGGDWAINLTFFPLSVLRVLTTRSCMGDFMSRTGLSDQTAGRLSPAASHPPFNSWPVHLCFVVFLFSSLSNTWPSCRGNNRCQLSNTFQLQMPGHSRTLLAFLHLKVQQFFVSPHHIIRSNAAMWGPF